MTKTVRDSVRATEESFHKHYTAIWGHERWHDSLYPALAKPTRYAALVNQYASVSAFWDTMKEIDDVTALEQIGLPDSTSNDAETKVELQCFARKLVHEEEVALNTQRKSQQNFQLPPPTSTRVSSGQQPLLTHWNLDVASVLTARLLNVQPGDDVMDLCAAPGGKSIALAQSIWPQLHDGLVRKPEPKVAVTRKATVPGRLCANESDRTRYKRLSENLEAYLPVQSFKSKRIVCHNIDAADSLAARKLLAGSYEGFDRVLVDAPCSSERHIVHAHLAATAAGNVAPEMANWLPGSSKRLAKTQADLLMTGLRVAKLGGSVVYATCSVETVENDGVIEKVLATVDKEVKKGGKWIVKVGFHHDDSTLEFEEKLEKEWAERTKYGWIILPDHPSGRKWGPLFFVMLTKVATHD